MIRPARIVRIVASAAGVGALGLLLWPLAYATWLSFTPHSMLRPPSDRWSLRWYRQFLESPQWTQGLTNSLVIGAMATGIAVVCGAGAAVALEGASPARRRLVAGAVVLPMLVPTVVLGMGTLPLVQALGLWGTRLSLAAAHGLWTMPVVFLVVRGALEALDTDLMAAARGLGASRTQVLARVTLPLITPGLLLGALMAFVLSLNEFLIALFLSTPDIETLPKVIWPSLRYTLTPVVAAASALSTGLTTLLIGLMAFALAADRRRRRAGRPTASGGR